MNCVRSSMWRLLLLSFLFLLPATTIATEFVHVEYDPEGSDAKREWVRIKNTNGGALDLTGWTFYENGTNHRLTPIADAMVGAGGTAIIASDASTFMREYPNSGDVVFDSSFSLSQSGETLELRDQSGATIARTTYKGARSARSAAEARVLTASAGAVPRTTPAITTWLLALAALVGGSGFALLDARRRFRGGSGYRIIAVEREKR